MFRDIGIPRERADANAFAARQFFDLRERQPVDVDQLRGRFHAHLHQIDQVRSAAEKFRLRLFRNVNNRCLRIARARKCKRIHACALVFVFLDRRDNIRIGAAATDVAAHPFANLRIARGVAFF